MFGLHKKSSIGFFSATSFAVGMMVGAGVFVLSGKAVGAAGPAAIGSFLIAGAVVLLSALCLVEVVRAAKGDANGYEAIGQILSPHVGFLVSWSFYVGSILGIAFVLNAFGVYVRQFVISGTSVAVVGVAALLILAGLNFISTSIVGRVETLLVMTKLIILVIFVVCGVAALKAVDLQPLFPHGAGAMIHTSAVLFIAYLGFNAITNISSEIKHPEKIIPRAVLASMAIVTVVYVGVCLAMISAHLTSFGEASVAQAAGTLMGPTGQILIVFGAMVATLSAANAGMLGGSDIMIRLASRQYVPTILAKQFRGHPFVSLSISVVAVALLLIFASVDTVIQIANVDAIVGLGIIDIAALVISWQRRRWIYVGLALLAAASALWQISLIPAQDIVWGVVALVAGFGLYGLRRVLYVAEHYEAARASLGQGSTPLMKRLNAHK